MPLDLDILGQGVYTPQEVARLVQGTPQEVLRWTRGSRSQDPLWSGYFHEIDNSTELSFSDLVEIRVVKALRQASVSLQAIRYAIDLAKHKFGVEKPLSSLRFQTDGKEILIDAIEKDGQLVSLSKKHPGQKVFKEVVRPSLKDLEYEGNRPIRWRPKGKKNIVIDPSRFFGDPVIDAFGVSTHTLYKEYLEFGDIEYLSQIYEIPKKFISEAIRFEKELDAPHGNADGPSII